MRSEFNTNLSFLNNLNVRFAFPPQMARDIKNRDGWRCQFPETGGHGGRLEAHHIIPQSYGNRIIDSRTGEQFNPDTMDNGITLCRDHHMQIHEGKQAWKDWNREHDVEFRKRVQLNTK